MIVRKRGCGWLVVFFFCVKLIVAASFAIAFLDFAPPFDIEATGQEGGPSRFLQTVVSQHLLELE